MTIQSQRLAGGQKTMPGLLPGALADQWGELGLFHFHKFQIENYHNRSFVCVCCGAEEDSCLKYLSYCCMPLYNFVFSVVYTELFNLPMPYFLLNPVSSFSTQ